MGNDLGPLMDQVHAPAEQVAGFPQSLGISVGDGAVAATQEVGNLLGIDLVVLRLAAVDGLHVEGVTQDEGNLLSLTQVCQPVPAEQALTGHDQAVAIRRNRFEERVRLRGHFLVQDNLAGLVEDAQVHCPGVQINPAVESVRLVVEAHHGLLWHGSGSLSPHRGWKATVLPENPTLGQKLRGFEPVYPWDRPRPIPSETMISIQRLKLTGAAILVFRASTSCRRPRQLSRAFGHRRRDRGDVEPLRTGPCLPPWGTTDSLHGVPKP